MRIMWVMRNAGITRDKTYRSDRRQLVSRIVLFVCVIALPVM